MWKHLSVEHPEAARRNGFRSITGIQTLWTHCSIGVSNPVLRATLISFRNRGNRWCFVVGRAIDVGCGGGHQHVTGKKDGFGDTSVFPAAVDIPALPHSRASNSKASALGLVRVGPPSGKLLHGLLRTSTLRTFLRPESFPRSPSLPLPHQPPPSDKDKSRGCGLQPCTYLHSSRQRYF